MSSPQVPMSSSMTLAWLARTIFIAVFVIIFTARIIRKYRPTIYRPSDHDSGTPIRVQILVLGDIGRSPRMQYHALSIARHGGSVDLVGYDESPLHPDLVDNERVRVQGLGAPPAWLKRYPFVLAAPLKVFWQIRTIFDALAYKTQPARWLLVQNPPTIPTLAIALVICKLRHTSLMIDWHNYGWTILAGTRGANHPFVKLSKAFECYFGRIAPTANLTVTHAMARQLQAPPCNIKSPILTLHDRPAKIFQPTKDAGIRRAFLRRLEETQDHADSIVAGETKLIVSSTSWTPDEDFHILLDGLLSFAKQSKVPIIAIITGKGPQKVMYEQKIAALQSSNQLPNIDIKTAWLSMEDYATLLASADLGISLHMSSSGVDLPMKVVDMFGAGLPVASYSAYESFSELVKEGFNGCGFTTADELCAIFQRLFDTPEGAVELKRLREGAVEEGSLRWDEEWDRVVGRLLRLTGHELEH